MPRSPGKQENILVAVFFIQKLYINHPKIYSKKMLLCQGELASDIPSAYYGEDTSLGVDISQNLMYLKNGSVHHTMEPQSHKPTIWLICKHLCFPLLVEKF